MNSKQLILKRLRESKDPLAVHELDIFGYSENNLATRLSELAKEGKVIGRFRKGTHYKEWNIPEPKYDENNQGVLLASGRWYG